MEDPTLIWLITSLRRYRCDMIVRRGKIVRMRSTNTSQPPGLIVLVMLSNLFIAPVLSAQIHPSSGSQGEVWHFAVSGDSRNCGDVVMPAIAAGVRKDKVSFYWHLGDYRALYTFDEDYLQVNPATTIQDYETNAWPDFIANQLKPFGDIPIFLAIGNHELVTPNNRSSYVQQFADWLDKPLLRKQRLDDNPSDHLLKTYYHWIDRGVDFITLDNASADMFDANQMKWFGNVLNAAATDPAVHTVVLGMHAALPDSLSAGHSMNDSPQEQASGRTVYGQLVQFRDTTKKNVYVLASHSHFVMNNLYETACRAPDDVLTGWLVGTAGAIRYRLPPEHAAATVAKTDVYGYLLATVTAEGTITFEFKPVDEKDVPASVVTQFTQRRVHWCFAENKSTYVVAGPVCGQTPSSRATH